MNSTARSAAEQIATLINSQPHSPRIDELEAIVVGVMTCQDTPIGALTPAVLEWHRMLADHDRWMGKDLSDGEWSDLLGTEVRRAKEAFAKPGDVALLGALCLHWNFPHHDESDQAEMRKLLVQPDGIGMDQQSLHTC
jgi:hypothetical protein